MTRVSLVSFLIVLAGSMLGCAGDSIQSRQMSILIEYRGDCLVACGSYNLSISASGEIRYKAEDRIAAKQHPKSKLSGDELNRLGHIIDEISYFDRQTPACGDLIEDVPSFWISVTKDNRKRRVHRHYGCTGQQGDPVFSLLRAVEEEVGFH